MLTLCKLEIKMSIRTEKKVYFSFWCSTYSTKLYRNPFSALGDETCERVLTIPLFTRFFSFLRARNIYIHAYIHNSYIHTVHIYIQAGIKCQLDATDVFIADLIACSTCFWHHYAHYQELKSIIQWLLPVVCGAVVFKLLIWCGAEGYVSGLQDAAASSC